MEKLDNLVKNKPKRNAKGQLLPGETANLNGRPKGKTIKEQVREWLENNPQDNSDFVKHFIKKNRELAWQMLEGRPQQDIVSDGKALPTPILGGISSKEKDAKEQGTN